MTQDLVPHTDTHLDRRVSFLPAKEETARIWGIAQTLAETDFVPKGIRGNVPAIMAAMLTGRELGILPLRALRQISIIEGKPTPSPELMMAMALKAGHDVYVAETSRERCVVEVRRADWPEDRVARLTWDLHDAEAAGLCRIDADTGRPIARSQSGKPLPWEAYTRAMLRSRAVSEACRTWLPDVVEGASYSPEELGAVVDSSAHDRDLVETAEERGETFDPLEGESDEVREAVAAAMGEEEVAPTGEEDVAVDANGDEIVDAELVEDEAPTAPESAPDAQEEDASETLEDAPGGDEASPGTDAPEEASTDEAVEESPAVEPSDEDPVAQAAGRSIEEPPEVDLADVPDPNIDEPAYAAWLAAATDAYASLNVTDANTLVRKRYVDLEDGRRLVVPGGPAGLDLIARWEEHTGSAFRKTIRAALVSEGWSPTTAVPSETTTQDDEETDLDRRRSLLRRWKAAHRELSQVAEAEARAALADRMEAGATEDAIWSTFELETLEDLVAKIEERRTASVPF